MERKVKINKTNHVLSALAQFDGGDQTYGIFVETCVTFTSVKWIVWNWTVWLTHSFQVSHSEWSLEEKHLSANLVPISLKFGSTLDVADVQWCPS